MNKIRSKVCSHCNKTKPATKEYFFLSPNLQGLESKCRKCKANDKRVKKYYYDKKEEHTSWLNGNDCIYM